ncbi:UDP-glycosyltransferase UGT5 [Frankliniella fusca]|uniref:UDP-glycosyltransferase UGT5 n=1 Tax=Frankliniella fusca TaxID=407009 RepID=A0AAE1LSB3_9NEOP|nr:UDP-glycosyltransferase UGT5 [Frankliniella fusca]
MVHFTTATVIALLAVLCGAEGARILAVFAMKGKSHTMVNEPLVRALAARGHAVDVFGHYVPEDANKTNVTYHALTKSGSLAPGLDIARFESIWLKPIVSPVRLLQMGQDDCAALFSDPAIRDLIQSNRTYDLFITELFNTDCYLGFGHRFQVPVVALSTSPILPWGNARFGNPDNPAHIPCMHSGWTDVMSLPERLVNAAIVYVSVLSQRLVYEARDQRWVDQAFGPGTPAVRDLARDTSLLLTNTFHALSLPRPLATNVVEVGGIHITAPQPLPKALAARGHELVVVSHFPQRRLPSANWTDISLEGTQVNLAGVINLEDGVGFHPLTVSFFDYWFITQFGHYSCDTIFEHPPLKDLVDNDRRGFDLIINENFNTNCFLGLVHRFRPAPYVSFSSCAPFSWDYHRVGSPFHSAVMPNTFLWFSDEMSFAERVVNTAFSMAIRAHLALVWDREAQRVVEKHLGPGVPRLADLAYNMSLMLSNTNAALNRAKPLVPGVVEVGGIHIGETKPLPQSCAQRTEAVEGLTEVGSSMSRTGTGTRALPGLVLLLGLLGLLGAGGAAVDGARILAVLPHAGRSHHQVFEPLLLELHRRGHRLTVLSHFPRQQAPRYHRDLDLRGTMPVLDSVLPLAALQSLNPFTDFMTIAGIGHDSCEPTLSLPAVRALLASNETFDLVIDEAFNTDCFLGFSHRFRPAPLVTLSSSVLMPWAGARVGNPLNPALQPNLFLWFTDVMVLWERALNAAFTALLHAVKAAHWDRLAQRVAERHFGPGLPPLRALARNASLLLVNAHFSLNPPLAEVPGIVEVGGLHIPDYAKPLPKDLEQFVAGAKDGVILFSLGSMIRASSLPKESAAALLRGFGGLKQRVVWKWEDEAPGPVPKNVRLSKWLPQFDVLCHNNTRLFIGHGGLLSTSEAAHCGVPLLGIAMYGDQRTNLAAVAKAGAGRSLPYSTLKNADLFIKNVRELLEDPSYQQSAKALSERFRDRPMSPLDTAVYWTEYVIRHQGAPHLRGAARNLAWYQEALLDVFGVLLLSLAAALYVVWTLARSLLRLVLRVGCSLSGACDAKPGANKKKQQ